MLTEGDVKQRAAVITHPPSPGEVAPVVTVDVPDAPVVMLNPVVITPGVGGMAVEGN